MTHFIVSREYSCNLMLFFFNVVHFSSIKCEIQDKTNKFCNFVFYKR